MELLWEEFLMDSILIFVVEIDLPVLPENATLKFETKRKHIVNDLKVVLTDLDGIRYGVQVAIDE